MIPAPGSNPRPVASWDLKKKSDPQRRLAAVAADPAQLRDDLEGTIAASHDEPDHVDDVKIRRCVAALLDDLARQGGQLSIDDVDRLTARRRLSPAETVEVWRGLDTAGVVLTGAAQTVVRDVSGDGTAQASEESTVDLVRIYLHQISRIPLLNATEEVTLARRIKAGDAAAVACSTDAEPEPQLRRRVELGRAAREQMITANLRLVVHVAKQYIGRSKLEFLDLVQEGTLGLIRAVEGFDFERGFKFSTYAFWWIRQAIARAIADKGRTIRLPVHVHERVSRMVIKRRRLTTELGREPSVRELADDLGETPETVTFMLDVQRDVISLDRPLDDDADLTLGDLVPAGFDTDPVELAEHAIRRKSVAAALDELPERQREVITLRFGLDRDEPRTLEEIGQQFGVSRERIRQIQVKTIEHLAQNDDLRRLQDNYG